MFRNMNYLTQNHRGIYESLLMARVYFRTGFKNNTLDEAIIVEINKSYSLRSLLALTSFSVNAESNAKNKPQTAMQKPNGVFIVLMITQLFIKCITVVSCSSERAGAVDDNKNHYDTIRQPPHMYD